MFVTKNQLFVFIACVAFGAVFGFPFTLSAILKKRVKKRLFNIIFDIFAFVVFTFSFVLYGYFMKFPSHRPYMTAGALAGVILYTKSFGLTLAKFSEKLYNITVKAINKTKDKKRDVKNVGRNNKKSGRRLVCADGERNGLKT